MIDDAVSEGPYVIRGDAVWYVYASVSFGTGSGPDPVRICDTSQNLAAAVDVDTGILHKHGLEDNVAGWLHQAQKAFRDGGHPQLADDLVMYSFPVTPETVEELNACIGSSGRAARIAERLARIGQDVGLSAMAPMGRA